MKRTLFILMAFLAISTAQAASLLPVPKQQFCDANGEPLASGTLTFYSPGTTDLKTVYTDSTGVTPASNPLTLDSAGRAEVWLSGFYDVLLKDSDGVTVWTVENVSSMGSTSIALSEWVPQDGPFTYISGTQFTLSGDDTSTYQVGRRIQATVAAGTITGTVTASAYSAPTTTVLCYWDTGSLDAGLSAVSVGLLSVSPTSIPSQVLQGYINAAGYGATQDSTTINAALTAIGSDPQTLLLGPGAWTISANVTFPANVTLQLQHGAILSNAADTVTFNGPLAGGPTQIVSGAGTFAWNCGQPFYFEYFGAVGDGSTEDTTAMQAALDISGTKVVTGLTGRTYVTDGLTIPSNTTLQAPPGGATIKLKANGDDNLLINSTPAAGNSGIHITGPWILDGNGSNQTGTAGDWNGIRLVNVSNCDIDGIEVKDVRTDGIKISNSHGVGIRNCYVHDSGETRASGGNNIKVEGLSTAGGGTECYDIDVSHNRVSGSQLQNNIFVIGEDSTYYPHHVNVNDNIIWDADDLEIEISIFSKFCKANNNTCTAANDGILLRGCQYCQANNNVLDGTMGGGITVWGSGGLTPAYNTVSGNIIEGALNDTTNGGGIKLTIAPQTTVSGNQVENCYRGIMVISSDDCVINGNQSDANDVYGILIQESSNCVVSANRCKNNGQSPGAIGNYAGITLSISSSECTKNIVTGNQCFDDQGSATQKYGIYLYAATDTILRDNSCYGNTDADLYDNYAAYTMVDGNIVFAAAPTTGTWQEGRVLPHATPAGASSPGWVCTESGTFSAATDATGDTDGSTAVITGMTDTSDFYVGQYVSVSAGFPSTGPYMIKAKTSTTMTLDTASDSSQSNITVDTPNPEFKAQADLGA